MDQLIQAFGIDGKLIIVQIINFVILTGLLTYFLYKPVLKVLAERKAAVEQGIKDAEAAAAKKAEAEEEKRAILSAAETQAKATGEQATSYAKEQAEGILSDAKTKADNVIKNAASEAAALETQARKDSEAEIAKLAVLAAEKVMREKTS